MNTIKTYVLSFYIDHNKEPLFSFLVCADNHLLRLSYEKLKHCKHLSHDSFLSNFKYFIKVFFNRITSPSSIAQ